MFEFSECVSLVASLSVFSWGAKRIVEEIRLSKEEPCAWEMAEEVDELEIEHALFKGSIDIEEVLKNNEIKLCRELGIPLESESVFADEEGFINTEVLEAFDLTGVEYGVLMNENDVHVYPTCCDKLICECAWEAKQ